MAVILCIVAMLFINSVKTEQQETVSEDITKMLEKLIEQIEAARRYKKNEGKPFDAIRKTDSQTFYIEGESDPNNFNDMAKNLSGNISKKNENKSSVFPSVLEKNSDILNITNFSTTQSLGSVENVSKSPIFPKSVDNLGISNNANSNNVSSLKSMLKANDSTFKQQSLQEKPSDEILSMAPRRTGNFNIDDSAAKYPENIFNEITYVNRNTDKSNNPDMARMQTSHHYYSPFTTTTKSSLKKSNEKFEKMLQNMKKMKKLQQFKIDITEPQYSTSMQRDVKMASNSFFQTSQIIPQVLEPFIIRRTPWLQQPHPQNLFLKPPSFLSLVGSYPRQRYQFQAKSTLLPRIKRKFIINHVPILVDKVLKSKNLWSFL